MSLRIRRGTDAQRQQITPDEGELIFTTNTQKLYMGDGITQGGVNIGQTLAGTGLVFDTITQTLQATGAGNGGGSGLTSVSQDLNPALGGNLNLNSRNITGTGNISVNGSLSVTGLGANLALNNYNITGTGNISVNGTLSVTGLGADLTLNGRSIVGSGNINTTGTLGVTGLSRDLVLSGYNITGTGNVNITGAMSATTISAGTGLGASLSLNNFDITGTGNVNITGNLTSVGGIVTSSYLSSNSPTPTTNGYTVNTPIYVGTNAKPISLLVKSSQTFGEFTGITDGTNTSGFVSRVSRGTLANPVVVQPLDPVFYMQAMGYDGTGYQVSGAFGVSVDQNATVTTGRVPGSFGAIVIDASGNIQQLTFDSKGKLTIPNLSIGGLTYYSPNYVTVSTTNSYSLSATLTYNMLLVTAGSLTATINMPASPTDGQLTSISVLTNTVTLAVGTGTVSPTFAGSAPAGTVYRYVYRATGTTWYRI